MAGTLALLAVGLALLVAGAECLVRGAAGLAGRLGVSPLVIGLTVVAFGTSSPELAVSLKAVLGDRPDIAVGNVVGSNIFNVLFILGVSALVTPLVVDQKLVRADVPIMIGASVALWLMARDDLLDRLEGVLLSAGIVAYTAAAIRSARRESAAVRQEYEQAAPPRYGRLPVQLGLIAAGLAACVLGSRWLVNAAAAIAGAAGVSELVIGLTIVAAGTSLPEVATSIVAAVRGQRDIAVGNVVGSNIFNILAILGFSAAVAPQPVPVSPAAEAFDIPVMTGVAVACLPIFFTGHEIRRWEGAMFLGFYAAYVTYLVLAAAETAAVGPFSAVMLWFVLPLAGLGVAGSVASALARRRGAAR